MSDWDEYTMLEERTNANLCPKCKWKTEHPQKHCANCSIGDMFEEGD